MAQKTKWIIASNRLPFTVDSETGELQASSGGLVTALSGVQGDKEIIWVGVGPEGLESEQINSFYRNQEKRKTYHPVFPSQEDYNAYYNGVCNNALWPLLHYEAGYVRFIHEEWDAYRKVNEEFARAIVDIAEDSDFIWIHDFHLFLVPKFVKELNSRLRVGFFLHTPFPSSEIFRNLPVRDEVLQAVLQADLVGFHDYSYLRHFCASVFYVLGLESGMLSVRHGMHTTQLGVFPVSIDVSSFKSQAVSSEVKKQLRYLKRSQDCEYLVLGVDRLDYIKGLGLKLRAFKKMLELYPDLQGRVALMQVAVPSRTDVPEYEHLKKEVDRLVGEINGEFGRPDYVPVRYIFSSVDFHQLLAFYQLADVLLITSRRDGMNLVALEYVASSRTNNPGVVVLSEFAGVAATLSHVIQTNPWDIVATAHNVARALTMDKREKQSRYKAMMRHLETYTATDWAGSFIKQLEKRSGDEGEDPALALSAVTGKPEESFDKLLTEIDSQRVLVLLDYDGTLVELAERPEQAILTDEAADLVRKFVKAKNVDLIVVSGRDRRFLSKQFGDIDVSLAAEHGARFFDSNTKKWKTLVRGDKWEWYGIVLQIMNGYVGRVPESFVETKQFGIAWHYRRSPVEFGEYQARRLKVELESSLVGIPVQVLVGKKVVEVRPIEASKGNFAQWFLENDPRFEGVQTIALGDDATDEDLFEFVIRGGGIAVKVGHGATVAPFRVREQSEVLVLLKNVLTYIESKKRLTLRS